MISRTSLKYYLGALFLGAALFFGAGAAQAQDICVFACWPGPSTGGVVVTFTISPSTITLGQSSTLSWSATGFSNCTLASGTFPSPGTAVTNPGSQVVTPATTGSHEYYVWCSGIFGASGYSPGTLTVNPAIPPAATASLSANPSSIFSGGSSLLTWGSTNATSCTGTNFSTGGATSGSVSTGALTSTQNYSVSCTGAGGSGSASRTVTVSGQPNLRISAGPTPTSAFPGTAQTYSATVQNNGTATAGASVTRFQRATSSGGAGATTIGDVNTSALGANATQVRSVSYTHSTAGTFYIRACADTASVVSESNESDNCSSWTAVVVSYPAVGGSCSASPSSTLIGQSTTWTATPSGGSGSYTYSWSGTNSLSGTSQSVSKTYTTTGTKTASVIITSAGNSTTVACSNSVTVSNTECSDGVDNNNNGLVDMADPACSSPYDTTEELLPSATLSLTPASSLVRPGDTVVLTWSAANATACTLTGTNGNSWALTGTSGTRTSSVLASETTFTLACTDLNLRAVSASTTVRIAPSFEEVLRKTPSILASAISAWF